MKVFEFYRFAKPVIPWLAGLLLCSNVFAAPLDSWRWHGFFNQGVIHTDDNNFFGDSSDTSFEFRSLGLSGFWQVSNHLMFSSQLIYRDAGETSKNGVNIDFAQFNYNLFSGHDSGLSLRAGRVKNPYGLYNETRDVAAIRPSILLPQSIYPAAFRDIFHTSDSVILSGFRQFDNWLVSFDLLAGRVPFDERSQRLLIPVPQAADIEDDELWGLRNIFEYDGGRVRIATSYIKFQGDIDTAPAAIFPGSLQVDSYILSFEYTWECYQLTSEYRLADFVYSDVFAPGLDSERTSQALYVQFGWQATEKLRVFTRYEEYYSDRDDKSGNGMLKFGRPKSDGFSEAVVLGAQYQLASDWLLAGEVHHVRGTAILPVLENPVASQVEENWNLYTLQLSYKF